jgi:dihydroorotase
MNPPLRPAADVAACIAGLVDGTIDCLATDHAPHLAEEKELEFQNAAFGILGLECALPLYVEALVTPGHISWLKLIDLMTAAAARIVRLNKGTLNVGADADVTLIDPNQKWTIDAARFASKSRNCPFHGRAVTGRAVMTIVAGEIRWRLS